MRELENHNQGDMQPDPNDMLGAEAITPFPVYSHKEQSRLMTFHNMLNRIHEVEESIAKGEKPVYGGIDNNGRVVEKYMDLDSKFLYIWKHRLQSMYETDFAETPVLKEAAENIRDTLEFKYHGAPAMTSSELSELWKRE